MSVDDAMYYIRLILGVIMGVICGALGLEGLAGLYVCIVGYVLSYYVIRGVLKVDPTSLEKPTRLFTVGGGTYVLIWIVTWTLTYTLLLSPS
ncbi:MAG: Rab5-interacting family protein [Thermoprotei archaeon]|nr:Rab5-interacting family protein [Thermoprotei archaeon]